MTKASALPVVVQVGFGGPRDLPAEHMQALRKQLTERLRRLRDALGPQHLLCGISQVAAGADALFAEACRDLQLWHRVFLPQPRDEYFDAKGSSAPDFTSDQKAVARALLDGPNVIEERVVSRASDRHERFEEVNLEIVRESDVILCITRPDAEAKAGGTQHLLQAARRRGKPVIELQLRIGDGVATLDEPRPTEPPRPSLPAEVAHAELDPSAGDPALLGMFLKGLKAACSRKATAFQSLFEIGAFIIIGTHVLATACAVLALLLHDRSVYPWLLGIELGLIASGFATHMMLHRREAVRVWAASRLIAEVARSVTSLRRADISLDYLFAIPHPASMQPLLRTLRVLHLASPKDPLDVARDTYVKERLTKEPGGQLHYYNSSLEKAESRLHLAHGLFYGFSISAFAATALKLATHDEWLTPILGVEAILLPVLAVSALSLAASFDLEARVHTFKEIHTHLKTVVDLLRSAESKQEFERLVFETEVQLLGETVTWASRRSFTSVA